MWCRHKWEESERFFAQRPVELRKISSQYDDDKTMERLFFGITTILYRCEKCGKPKIVEILGRITI